MLTLCFFFPPCVQLKNKEYFSLVNNKLKLISWREGAMLRTKTQSPPHTQTPRSLVLRGSFLIGLGVRAPVRLHHNQHFPRPVCFRAHPLSSHLLQATVLRGPQYNCVRPAVTHQHTLVIHPPGSRNKTRVFLPSLKRRGSRFSERKFHFPTTERPRGSPCACRFLSRPRPRRLPGTVPLRTHS